MPGKQMAIDAEMNAGAIDEAEARRRRQSLVRESEFYGTMDGASKFVRGDAIAGVIITAINLVGGITIGLINGQPVAAAVRTYSVLTVGDGLVTQIPALIIATAAGMLVTKATSQASLGQEIGQQVAASAGPLRLGSMILFGLALVPGLPKVPFLALGAGLFFLGRRLADRPADATAAPQDKSARREARTPAPAELHLDDFLQTDRISVEIGPRLLPLVDTRGTPGLLDRISGLRRDLARQAGLWVPTVRVRDNIHLDGDAYRVLVLGREVARGSLRPGQWLAINPGGATLPVPGEATAEPAFGLPATWIADADRSRAELAGYTVVDAPSVLITHLGEVVRRHAHELLSREDLKQLVDKVRESAPAVVDELIPNLLTTGALHRVLTLLLEERVPITHLGRILESLATHAHATKDLPDLTERVRTDIGRTICDRFRDDGGRLRAVVLDPRLEVELRRAVQDKQLALDPSRLEQLILRLAGEWRAATGRGHEVALLCDGSLRRPLRHALARSVGDLSVIAYQEIPTDLLMEPAAVIRPEDLAEPAAARAA
jgi:flagellar biosynthesis protein FlhA